jgi:hypothetical protein
VGLFWPYLSMPSRRIFDSKVWRGIPSFAAAPEGPEIRPWLSARAASIISTSRSSNAEKPLLCGVFGKAANEVFDEQWNIVHALA